MRIVKEGETEREWMSARSQQPDDKDTVAEAPKAFILLWQIFIAQLFLYSCKDAPSEREHAASEMESGAGHAA